jgi:hypothetical protein
LQHLLKAVREQQIMKTANITHPCSETEVNIFYMPNHFMKGMCTLLLVILDFLPITGQPEE